MKACKEGQLEVIQYLLEAQLAQKQKGAGPLGGGATAKSAEQGEIDVCKMLLDEGASAEQKDDEGWNVLMWAALAGQLEICEMLVKEFNAEATYATEKGESAMMKAAANGYWDVCEFLLDEGAKANQLDVEHQTSLMWALAEGHLETVKGLLSRDAKID